MKVAIIGAGLAGLSCAHELERHGIKPTLYEVNNFIGESFPHVGAALGIATRSIGDPIEYIKNEFSIDIAPINIVKRIIHHAPHRTTTIDGNHGYFLERSRAPNDIKVQIYTKLKNSQIEFNTHGDYKSLSKKFEYIVITNGSNTFTKELGCWFEWVNTYVRGSVILGDFDPNTMIIWLNKDYCKNGYAYLTPFDRKRASLNLVVTDVGDKEVDHFWELFLYTEHIHYKVEQEFKINHLSGLVYPPRVGNLLLAGNAVGVIDPFLGFGVLGSIGTGVMAARAIVKNKNYEKLIRPILQPNLQLREFRKALNATDNQGYDKLISIIGLPGIKQLIYDTPLDVIKHGSFLLKFITKEYK